MKITKTLLRKIIKEELIREAHEFRTGVPEEDVLQHGLDTEMYPTTKEEEASDMIAAALEAAYALMGGEDLETVDGEFADKAMELRNWVRALAGAHDDDMDDDEYDRRVARGEI